MTDDDLRTEIHRLHILWQELEEQHRPVEADAVLARIERLSKEDAEQCKAT